jgi:hypothetical protein
MTDSSVCLVGYAGASPYQLIGAAHEAYKVTNNPVCLIGYAGASPTQFYQ